MVGIATILRRTSELLVPGTPALVVVNDRRDLYPEILRRSGLPPRRPARAARQPPYGQAGERVLRVGFGLCTRIRKRSVGVFEVGRHQGMPRQRPRERGNDMRKVLRRPSPAMVVACLALLVALGGTSVAAVSQVARNSVGTGSDPGQRGDGAEWKSAGSSCKVGLIIWKVLRSLELPCCNSV